MQPRTRPPSSARPGIDAPSQPIMAWTLRWLCSRHWGGSRQSVSPVPAGSTALTERSFRCELSLKSRIRIRIERGVCWIQTRLTFINPPSWLQNEKDLSSLDCPSGMYCPTPAVRLPCPAGSYCIEKTVTPITCDFNYLLSNSPYTGELCLLL